VHQLEIKVLDTSIALSVAEFTLAEVSIWGKTTTNINEVLTQCQNTF